jgi:hypothetical protein
MIHLLELELPDYIWTSVIDIIYDMDKGRQGFLEIIIQIVYRDSLN